MSSRSTPCVCEHAGCGKEFMAPKGGRFCSRQCVGAARRKHPYREPHVGPHICQLDSCRKEYEPTGGNQKYCSKRCWRIWARIRWGSQQCSICPAATEVWRDRDGQLRCATCSSYWRAHGVERPPIRIRATEERRRNDGLKLCRRCDRDLPHAGFPRDRKGKPRRYCISCTKEYLREWHDANPDKVASQRAAYRASKHGRAKIQAATVRKRARRRAAVVEEFDPVEIFERDRWICKFCKKRVSKKLKAPHPKSATLDHMIPISLGGKHERANVQLMHYGCNSAKHTRCLPQGEQLLLFG